MLTGAAFFLTEEDGQPVGFAQCQLRHDYVEGTDSSPAGYPEGIFTEEAVRGKGDRRRPPCPVRKLGKRKELHRICQ